MMLNAYKIYLIKELCLNGCRDISNNIIAVDKFMSTPDGKNGLLAFEIKTLYLGII